MGVQPRLGNTERSHKEGEVLHRLPKGVLLEPVEVSIVVPALNEEITVGEFVDWCHEGLRKAGVKGQILIVDSSTDRTPEIVLERGGEVLQTPKRGLGRAYIDSIPYIRGQFVVMGDADLTYDFRELLPFVERFRAGAHFVMGSRFRGSIEEGAMPPLHRYFGTPLTTFILNLIYGSAYTDIHCGMRGLSVEAFHKIDLRSQSWEYASEMVLKAARLKIPTAEVPVKFYKDREGRDSHLKRGGWLAPWKAGWINLKVMLVYSPDTFLFLPGCLMFVLGTLFSLCLSGGPIQVGSIGFNLHWMLLGLMLSTLGYSFLQIGVVARVLHRLQLGVVAELERKLTYDRGMGIAGCSVLFGGALVFPLVVEYFRNNFRLTQISHPAIFGILVMILGFQTFCFVLLLEMIQRVVVKRPR
ncbi:MAG: glycosyltransferase family 2 protein [Verrucomicrobiota bacterium]